MAEPFYLLQNAVNSSACLVVISSGSFFLNYLIDYVITVILIFLPLPPSTQNPTPSGNPHTIVHVHGSCV